MADFAAGVDWEFLSVNWKGWDGSTWDLANGTEGATLLAGARGFTFAASNEYLTQSPVLHGGRYVGFQVKPRELFLPIRVQSDAGSGEWLKLNRAFIRTMRRDQIGTLTVGSDETRTMQARFYDDGGTTLGMMPSKVGRQTYTLYLHATDPFWHGADAKGVWLPPPAIAESVWNAPGGVAFITGGHDTTNATITNPGDFPSHPTWIIDGYTPAATVGVGSDVVALPFPVAAGKCAVINTDPTMLNATMYDVPSASQAIAPLDRVIGVDLINPTDLTLQLGAADFAPIPPGTDVALNLQISGTGLVSVRLPTLYEFAF